jgi:thiosulfate/3-mercaptopyruvate sulfurtransferase
MNASLDLPLLLQAEDLAAQLPSDEILVVAVCSEKVFAEGHLPGAILVQPRELVCGVKPATGKLPTQEHLNELFSRLGLSQGKHLVAYDDEGGGWAGRLLWTLDVVGHSSYSLLDGGQIAWAQAELPLTVDESHPTATDFQASIDRSFIAELDEVIASINADDVIVWDARTKEEYAGTKITALKNGHIPGAVNLDWLDVMDRDNGLRLKSLNLLQQQLASLGITKGKKIITHCQTHHRSGLTYFVGKLLGLNIKAYDGSWSEWGNHPETAVDV